MADQRDGVDLRHRRRRRLRAGSALHTLLVDDLDAFLAELATRGVDTGPVETIGDAVRRTTVTDADGNRLNVGQPPPQAAGA